MLGWVFGVPLLITKVHVLNGECSVRGHTFGRQVKKGGRPNSCNRTSTFCPGGHKIPGRIIYVTKGSSSKLVHETKCCQDELYRPNSTKTECGWMYYQGTILIQTKLLEKSGDME